MCPILFLDRAIHKNNFNLVLGGISNSGVDAKWPPLDDYQAPKTNQDQFLVAPTTNTISKGNILSILPPPTNYNRAPRTIFSPSMKITPTTTSRPAFKYSQPNLGFVPVTPSWLRTSTTTPRPINYGFRQKPVNTIMTVKHGIIPILKSRLQQQRRQRARHKTPRLYKYFAK